MARSNEPLFWGLFSSGGMLSALLFPALAVVLLLALPFGWLAIPPSELAARLGSPWLRIALFALAFLGIFHWAHRFRFTLYDGLQLYHLAALIAVISYGGATVVTLVAAWVLWPF